jgi:DNA polymerase
MAKADPSTEMREELASVAASLRAYLEWQQDTGAMGIPRKPRSSNAAPRPRADAPAASAPPPAVTASASSASPAPAVTASASPVPDVVRASAVPEAVLPPRVVTPPAAPPPPAVVRASPPPLRALSVVAAEAKTCTKCGLAATRTNVVFARGNPEARICFVGEAPGADEDAEGLPFVGRAGQLLDKMIAAMGLDPAKDVYVCNIIKCRPPGNRKPEPIEIETCIPYLHEQLAAVDPKAIVALGNTAVAALLGTKLGITKVRGQWKLYRGKIPVMPTYHPSYLLRPSPQQVEAKKQAWDDLQAVMKELGLPPKKA